MVKVSASQPQDRGFKPCMGHNHNLSYGTSIGWFQEADSRVLKLSCENLLHNRAKIKSLN